MSTTNVVEQIDVKEIDFINSNPNVLSLTSSSLMVSNIPLVYPPTEGMIGTYLMTDGLGNTSWSVPFGANSSVVSLINLSNNSSTPTNILSSNVNYINDPNIIFNTSGTNLLLTLPANNTYIVEISTYFNNASVIASNYFIEILNNVTSAVVFSSATSVGGVSTLPVVASPYSSRWLFQPVGTTITYYFNYYNSASGSATMNNFIISVYNL